MFVGGTETEGIFRISTSSEKLGNAFFRFIVDGYEKERQGSDKREKGGGT